MRRRIVRLAFTPLFMGIAPSLFVSSNSSASAATSSEPSAQVNSANYPRIANVDGYTSASQASAMSRYGLLIMANNKQSASLVTAAKQANPNEQALMEISAGMIHAATYDGHTYSGWSVYPGWWLTLAGTILTKPITATQTTITVANAQVILANLATNPYVLIDGETVLVTAVDVQSNTLTVKRGVFSATSSHAAGARAAAHAGANEDWQLNLSSDCPKDPATGYRWADYLAHQVAQIVKLAHWDGVYFKDMDLSPTTPYFSQVDANNDNVPDGGGGSSGMDWYDGQVYLIQEMRTLLSDLLIDGDTDSVIPGLGGIALQHVTPDSQWSSEIDRYLFGTTNDTTGTDVSLLRSDANGTGVPVLQAMRFGLASALLADGYYAYDNGTSDSGATWWYDEYDNGAGSSLAQPIGTTDTTLNLAPSTGTKFHKGDVVLVPDTNNGEHGDEQMLVLGTSGDALTVKRGYNDTTATSHAASAKVVTPAQLNAGLGWLGQPLGAAYDQTLTTPSLVTNGDFSAGSNGWTFTAGDPAEGTWSTTDDVGSDLGSSSAHVTVAESDAAYPANVTLAQRGISLSAGEPYTLSFNVKSSIERSVTAVFGDASIYATLDRQDVTSSPEWTTETVTFTPTMPISDASISFLLGGATGDVWISDVRLQQGDPNVWRRDFTNGTVILNATGDTQTVDVGPGYRHIAGSQDPLTNNGQPASSVKIGSDDAVLLVKSN